MLRQFYQKTTGKQHVTLLPYYVCTPPRTRRHPTASQKGRYTVLTAFTKTGRSARVLTVVWWWPGGRPLRSPASILFHTHSTAGSNSACWPGAPRNKARIILSTEWFSNYSWHSPSALTSQDLSTASPCRCLTDYRYLYSF